MSQGHRLAAARWLWPLAALVVMVGCGQPEEPTEIRLGFLVDRSTAGFESSVAAARLAVMAANAAGGVEVAGRAYTIKLLSEDTGDTPEGTTRATLKLINQDKVVAIVGSSFSRNAIPSGGIAEQAGVLMVCPGASHRQTTAGRRFVFRVTFVDSFQGRVMARFAREDLRLATAAVLYDIADAYSRDIAAVFREAFEEADGEVVAFESFASGDEDFTRQLERIRDTDPAILFLPNFSREVLAQTNQARRLGITSVFLGSDGWPTDRLRERRNLNGAFVSLSWHPGFAAVYEETRELMERYRKVEDREPNELGALTYDAFGLLFDAAGRASKVEASAIREALSQTVDYPGVTGPITYRDLGGDPRRNAVIGQFIDDELRLFKVVDPYSGEGL